MLIVHPEEIRVISVSLSFCSRGGLGQKGLVCVKRDRFSEKEGWEGGDNAGTAESDERVRVGLRRSVRGPRT